MVFGYGPMLRFGMVLRTQTLPRLRRETTGAYVIVSLEHSVADAA